MSESDERIERAIRKVIGDVHAQPTAELALSPASGLSFASGSPTTRAALRRCRAAWRRAYNDYMKNSRTDNEFIAADEASKAYCGAMPLLAGLDGIRDFIACAAYGILIGAIPANRSGQILYAAQVAFSTLPRDPKSA
ncbi:MAG: hypothetical protein WBX18_20430 [Terracidiphilus sp.]